MIFCDYSLQMARTCKSAELGLQARAVVLVTVPNPVETVAVCADCYTRVFSDIKYKRIVPVLDNN